MHDAEQLVAVDSNDVARKAQVGYLLIGSWNTWMLVGAIGIACPD